MQLLSRLLTMTCILDNVLVLFIASSIHITQKSYLAIQLMSLENWVRFLYKQYNIIVGIIYACASTSSKRKDALKMQMEILFRNKIRDIFSYFITK